MSDYGESCKDYKEAQQKRRAERLPKRQNEIESLTELGYSVKKLTEYQYRINDTYDLYPIHNNFHHLKSGKRGSVKSLSEFIKKSLPL